MATGLKPIRRVVTGNDEQGKSKVVWDGPAPTVHPQATVPIRGWTDLWVWNDAPLALSGPDEGNNPYAFPGPATGGHFRVVESPGKPAGYDAAKDPQVIPFHDARERADPRTWDRGGDDAFSSAMHKTETIDYGIVLEGERVLELDDSALVMKQGDIVVQVGAWHRWTSPREGALMAFDMIAAKFEGGYPGTVHKAAPRKANGPLPEGVKPARRIVTVDNEKGQGTLVSDGPAPDVRTDSARPGYAAARLWVTDGTPSKIITETLDLPNALVPPAGGSVCSVVTFPPDANWQGKVGAAEVQAFFRNLGEPNASTYSASAPHAYMMKTRTVDFCLVLEGEITLVLDTQAVPMKAGDIAIVRGSNHAWSNHSNNPARLAIANHDAR